MTRYAQDSQTTCGKARANAATWKVPGGHATWCATAVPFIRLNAAGGTAMAKASCSCGKNPVARSLRRLNGRIR